MFSNGEMLGRQIVVQGWCWHGGVEGPFGICWLDYIWESIGAVSTLEA